MYRSKRPLLVALVASCFALLVLVPAVGAAQSSGQIGSGKNIGLGLGRGTLTSGITGKFYLDRQSAIQAYIGSFGDWYAYGCNSCGISLSGEYMYEFANLVEEDVGRLFAGGGGGAFLYSINTFGRYHGGYAGAGIHGVFDLGWQFREFPLEIAIDIRPGFDFGLYQSLFIDWGGSLRIFF